MNPCVSFILNWEHAHHHQFTWCLACLLLAFAWDVLLLFSWSYSMLSAIYQVHGSDNFFTRNCTCAAHSTGSQYKLWQCSKKQLSTQDIYQYFHHTLQFWWTERHTIGSKWDSATTKWVFSQSSSETWQHITLCFPPFFHKHIIYSTIDHFCGRKFNMQPRADDGLPTKFTCQLSW